MKLKYISWIPAVVIIIMIFLYSSKPADDSNASSLKIADKIFTMYEKITQTQYSGEEKLYIMGNINHIVRKSAHFCEYTILSIAFAFHLLVIGTWRKRLIILPILLSFLNASIDEFHQTFVQGRAGMFKDVALDTLGAATGSVLFTLIAIGVVKLTSRKKTRMIN